MISSHCPACRLCTMPLVSCARENQKHPLSTRRWSDASLATQVHNRVDFVAGTLRNSQKSTLSKYPTGTALPQHAAPACVLARLSNSAISAMRPSAYGGCAVPA